MRRSLVTAAVAASMLLGGAGTALAGEPPEFVPEPAPVVNPTEGNASSFLQRVLRRNSDRLVRNSRVLGDAEVTCYQREESSPPRFACAFRVTLVQRLRYRGHDGHYARKSSRTDPTPESRRPRIRRALYSCVGAASVRADGAGNLSARVVLADCSRIRRPAPEPVA